MLISKDFIAALPQNDIPQETEGYEGFFHLSDLQGTVEKTTLEYIIRDHDMKLFEERKALMLKAAKSLNDQWGSEVIQIEIKDQYYNMRKMVEPVMHIVDIAEQAMKDGRVKSLIKAI